MLVMLGSPLNNNYKYEEKSKIERTISQVGGPIKARVNSALIIDFFMQDPNEDPNLCSSNTFPKDDIAPNQDSLEPQTEKKNKLLKIQELDTVHDKEISNINLSSNYFRIELKGDLIVIFSMQIEPRIKTKGGVKLIQKYIREVVTNKIGKLVFLGLNIFSSKEHKEEIRLQFDKYQITIVQKSTLHLTNPGPDIFNGLTQIIRLSLQDLEDYSVISLEQKTLVFLTEKKDKPVKLVSFQLVEHEKKYFMRFYSQKYIPGAYQYKIFPVLQTEEISLQKKKQKLEQILLGRLVALLNGEYLRIQAIQTRTLLQCILFNEMIGDTQDTWISCFFPKQKEQYLMARGISISPSKKKEKIILLPLIEGILQEKSKRQFFDSLLPAQSFMQSQQIKNLIEIGIRIESKFQTLKGHRLPHLNSRINTKKLNLFIMGSEKQVEIFKGKKFHHLALKNNFLLNLSFSIVKESQTPLSLLSLASKVSSKDKSVVTVLLRSSDICCKEMQRQILGKKNLSGIGERIQIFNVTTINQNFLFWIAEKHQTIEWSSGLFDQLNLILVGVFTTQNQDRQLLMSCCVTNSRKTAMYSEISTRNQATSTSKDVEIIVKAIQQLYFKSPCQEVIVFVDVNSKDYQIYQNLGNILKLQGLKLTVIIVNSSNEEAFFSWKQIADSPDPGLVVNKPISSDTTDFVVISEKGNSTAYKILENFSRLQILDLQKIILDQCFCYVNWKPQFLKEPQILEYAKKCARFNAEVMNGTEVPSKLKESLYFV